MGPGSRAVTPPATPERADLEYDSAMKKRPTGLIAAVVLLVVLLGAALAVLLSRPDSAPQQASPGSTTTGPSMTSLVESASPSPAAIAGLTEAPAGVAWELFQGVALPTSATDGPRRVDGPVHAGYTRTPTGALLAAAQIESRRLISPGTSWRQVVEEQVIEGPGRTAYVTLRAQVTDDEPPAGGYTQFVGFRYITYSPDLAVVSLATRGSRDVNLVRTSTVKWLDGDWRVEIPAAGVAQGTAVAGLQGYVPWSGIS